MNIDKELNQLFNTHSPEELRNALAELFNQHSAVYSLILVDQIPDDHIQMISCTKTLIRFLDEITQRVEAT